MMNILMCINDGYVHPLLGLMHSVRKYNKDEITLYVLSTQLSDDNKTLIKQKLGEESIDVIINVVDCKESPLANFQHYTYDMFLRVFAFDLLPKEIDRILYLDADMLVLKDIAPIYNTDLDDKFLGAVRDFGVKFKKVAQYVKWLDVPHLYFNSGMLIMNLALMRSKWNRQEIEAFITTKAIYFSCPDQDALNLLCKEGDVLQLPDEYNYQVKSNEKLDNDEAVVLHYVGYNKPWNHYVLGKHEKLFWSNYKELNIDAFYKLKCKNRRKRIKVLYYKIINRVKKLFKRNKNLSSSESK